MTTLLRTSLLLVLLLSLSACADAELATGSGAPDVEVGSESEAPIPVEPDGGIGDGAGPLGTDSPIPVEGDGGIGGEVPPSDGTAPTFGVSSETDSLSAEPFSYCWTDPDAGSGVCADGLPDASLHPITVADQLVVTYEPGTLSATVQDGSAEGIVLPVDAENPGVNLVDTSGLPAGEHVLDLFWSGEQGDAATQLALTVAR